MNVVSVTELNEYIKRKFDSDFILRNISVAGEISNYVAHSSGHAYFSLKDKTGVLKCIMFKGYKQYLDFVPKNGMSVTAIGDVNVFVRDGVYQLYVMRMIPEGIGELFQKYEELKKRLAEEGLFDEQFKLPLPRYPERIGVITSETGAVLHDIRNVLSRRYPLAELKLYPAKVQGEGAAKTVIDALEKMNYEGDCDVAIIARGGGSFEDLWEFNDEQLAYVIRASAIPVISAVGHETDFTIADFAADLRAPTPSAAAELCVPDIMEVRQILDQYAMRLQDKVYGQIDTSRRRLEMIFAKLGRTPMAKLNEQRFALKDMQSRIGTAMQGRVTQGRMALLEAAKKLEKNDPAAILMRGYGAVYADDRRVVRAKDVNIGDRIAVQMQDGCIRAEITDMEVADEI